MRITVPQSRILEAFDEVKDDPSFAESRALVEQGKMPVEMLQAFALHPQLLQAFSHFSCIYPLGLIERPLKEKVILESSRRNECQFCRDSHVALMRQLGIAADPLASLDNTEAQTPREQIALAYTRAAMTDSNRVPDTLFAELKQHFTDPEIVELTFLIGFINMLNLFNNSLQVTFHNDYDS